MRASESTMGAARKRLEASLIVGDSAEMAAVVDQIEEAAAGDSPVLIDKFLDGAIEVDVDVVADFEPTHTPTTGKTHKTAAAAIRRQALVCGVLEQIEQAGIHSGDSACTLPPLDCFR